jgi:4-aminobutyrate aminotransferase-like enzyme
VFDKMVERHIMPGKGGVNKNMLRIQAPMCLNEGDVDYTLAVLEDIVKSNNF